MTNPTKCLTGVLSEKIDLSRLHWNIDLTKCLILSKFKEINSPPLSLDLPENIRFSGDFRVNAS